MASNKFSFWKFITKYRIEIPIMQRDYAQGRAGRELLRRSFLRNIKEALDRDEGQELLLDFIYGSIATPSDCFHPLDGQQRLTTLWLIHWYIAFRAGKLKSEADTSKKSEADTLKKSEADTLKRFTYETRVSSREFCRLLCSEMELSEFVKSGIQTLKEYIPAQKWFPSSWRHDPTIDAMLRMISGADVDARVEGGADIKDGIERIFAGTKDEEYDQYWKKLTGDSAPIVFYIPPMESFGPIDDLYIKMNARGKQLSSLENFKADLVGYLQQKAEEERDQKGKWAALLDPKEGIPYLMDTRWTDLFWAHSKTDNSFDEMYLSFINRFFWNELFSKDMPNQKSVESEEIEKSSSCAYLLNAKGENYLGLDPYCIDLRNKEIPIDLFENLKKVLNGVAQYDAVVSVIDHCRKSPDQVSNRFAQDGSEGSASNETSCSLPQVLDCFPPYENSFHNPSWINQFSFIPSYPKKENEGKERAVISLTYRDRVAFFALCKYFKEGGENVDADGVSSLKRWMRVVWNLISGEKHSGEAEIDGLSAVRVAMQHIAKLKSHDVYKSLCEEEETTEQEQGAGGFAGRWKEEIEKARKIYDDKSGLRLYKTGVTWEDILIEAENYAFFHGSIRFLFRDANGKVSWNDFDTKWEHAQEYFDKEGARDKKDDTLLRAFFSRLDPPTVNKEALWYKSYQVFNNEPGTWRYFLLHGEACKSIHELLIGNKTPATLKKPSIGSVGQKKPSISSVGRLNLDDWKKKQEIVLYQLSQTNLLRYILTKESDEAREYWISRILPFDLLRLAILPKANKSERGVLLDALERDDFLRDPEVTVDGEITIGDKELFYGFNVPFEFRGNQYEWQRDDHICLVRDGIAISDSDKCVMYEEGKYKEDQTHNRLKQELSNLADRLSDLAD